MKFTKSQDHNATAVSVMPTIWATVAGMSGVAVSDSLTLAVELGVTITDSYGRLHAQRGYGEPTRPQAKRAVLERVSGRGVERVLGLSRRTLARWLEGWAEPS